SSRLQSPPKPPLASSPVLLKSYSSVRISSLLSSILSKFQCKKGMVSLSLIRKGNLFHGL
ncbi:MAG: hypothetical protein KHW76_03610, partial [Oscillibacter sp.]|nr:hypothetical protein [Oscillibacter sp.]